MSNIIRSGSSPNPLIQIRSDFVSSTDVEPFELIFINTKGKDYQRGTALYLASLVLFEREIKIQLRVEAFNFLSNRNFLNWVNTDSELVVPSPAEIDAEYEQHLTEWLSKNMPVNF
ncbi:hypothetical protein JZU61_00810 [bacterium]|nr:hypothetical protein [bacterium]